jgi:hypothetical protein
MLGVTAVAKQTTHERLAQLAPQIPDRRFVGLHHVAHLPAGNNVLYANSSFWTDV